LSRNKAYNGIRISSESMSTREALESSSLQKMKGDQTSGNQHMEYFMAGDDVLSSMGSMLVVFNCCVSYHEWTSKS